MQSKLNDVLARLLPAGQDPSTFELHAAEMKSPRHQRAAAPSSPWQNVDLEIRLQVLSESYHAIRHYRPLDDRFPIVLFGDVVEGQSASRDSRAYEEVLHKFDEMLTRRTRELGERQTGLVIHDKRSIERDVQRAAQTWRHIAGRMGVLTHLADVPLFADSRASRLIQAADLTSWALWRYYGLPNPDSTWVDPLWPLFDGNGVVMHGLIHVSPRFRTGCTCPPCASRTQTTPL